MSSSDSSYRTDISIHSAEEYEDDQDVIDRGLADDSDTDEAGPDRFDPVAENSFTERYEREMNEKRNVERGLSKRFHGSEPLSSWHSQLQQAKPEDLSMRHTLTD
eukprot:gene16319-biopygen11999